MNRVLAVLKAGLLNKTLLALCFVLLAHIGFAADDPFEVGTDTITEYAKGSFGVLVAVIVMLAGLITSAVTKRFGPLGFALVIAVFAGGIVDIALMMFGIGGTSFGG